MTPRIKRLAQHFWKGVLWGLGFVLGFWLALRILAFVKPFLARLVS